MRNVLVVMCLSALPLLGGEANFGAKELNTKANWSWDGTKFNIKISAKGMKRAGKMAGDRSLSTSYGLLKDNEAVVTEREGICLSFDANNDGVSFFVVLIDGDGKTKVSFVNVLDWRKTVNIDIKPKILMDGDSWVCSFSFSPSQFGCRPGEGDVWRFAFGRKSLRDGKTINEFSEGETCAFTYGPSSDRQGWKLLPVPALKFTFPAKKNSSFNVICETRGACDPSNQTENTAIFAVSSSNSGKVEGIIEAISDDGSVIGSNTILCLPGQINNFILDYNLSGRSGSVVFKMRLNGTIVYSSKYPIMKRLALRVRPIVNAKPFPIDSQATRPVNGYNGMTWSQLEGNNRGAWFADNFGWPWKRGEWFVLCRREKLMPWMISYRYMNHYNNAKKHRKEIQATGVKIAITPQTWELERKKWLKLKMYGGFIADPKDYENYFKNLRKSLVDFKTNLGACFTMDEGYFQLRKRAVKLFTKHKDDGSYPFIEKVDAEIKKRFGYGKFGIPQSTKDKNPFRWVALKLWAADFMDRFEKKVIREVRAINPNIPIMSPDLVGDMLSADISRWRDGRFDIYLTQLNNHRRANAFNGVFQCRMLRDLARPKNLWGCTHLEDSAEKFSLEEMRVLFSYYVQNGLTGLHTWPLGGRRPWMLDSRISRPEVWNYFVDAAEYLGNGARPPSESKPKTAIFVSELSQMSIPGYWDWVGFVEPAYTVLGGELKTDFQIISDLSVKRGLDSPSDFKLIVAPFLRIADATASKKLLAAVENGSTLLITDPAAFAFLPDGTRPNAIIKSFFGKTIVTPTKHQMRTAISLNQAFLKGANLQMRVPPPTLMKLLGRSYSFKTAGNAVPLMKYEDGSTAAVVIKRGKGEIIITGFNPYSLTSNQPVSWNPVAKATKKFFSLLLSSTKAGSKTDVWGFELPAAKRIPFRKNICLSGNSMFFRQTLPKTFLNADIGMTYTYNIFPDMKKDVKDNGWISVTEGRLTDRIAVMLKNRNKQNKVSWKKAENIEIMVDLKGLRSVAELAMFVARQNPEVSLLGSLDGKSYQILEKHPAGNTPTYVEKISLKNIKGKWRYLKIRVSPSQPLTIVEMEIWEKTQK